MGKIINEEDQIKKSNVIRTDRNQESVRQNLSFMLDDNMNGINIQNRAVSSNEIYFDRIIRNSANKNTSFRVRIENELEKDNWKKAGRLGGIHFSQQYPTAVKDRLFGSSENRKINEDKRIFRNADLCTVREKDSLKELFASDEYKAGVAGADAKDEIFNPDLIHYVNYMINNQLKPEMLTDDYLSKHISTVYGFTRRLLKYNEIRKQYPVFFNSIPETKKIALERMATYAKDLNVLVSRHLNLHGLIIDKDQNGNDRVNLRKESDNKTERHTQRQQLKEEYDQLHRAFLKKAFEDEDLELAGQFTKNKFVNESGDLEIVLTEQFKKESDVYDLFSPQIEKAIEEIKNTLSVRDDLVEAQKGNLEQRRMIADRTGSLRRTIRHTNDKLMLCSEHIDHYKQYLYFLNGNISELREETVSFLIREKQESLLEPVKFKVSLQCAEEALALRNWLDKKDNNVKFKPEKLTKEQFYEKRRLLDETRKKGEKRREDDLKWNKVVTETAKKAKDYAGKNHLKPASGRLSLSFKDPNSEYLKGDSYFFIYLASNYSPTEETPDNVKTEIAEKGIRPWLKTILETMPENYTDHVIKKDEDFSSKGYYERYARTVLGLNADEFLRVLKNYDVGLEEDDALIIKTYGRVMHGAVNRLNYVNEKINIPLLNVLGSDERIFKESDRIQDILSKNGSMSNEPEVKKFRKKYSKLLTGIEIDGVKLPGGLNAVRKSVPDYLKVLFMPLSAAKNQSYADDVDLEEEFYFFLDQEKKKAGENNELRESAAGIEEERDEVSEEQNGQLENLNGLQRKGRKAGPSTALYRNIQEIDTGLEKRLNKDSKEELKVLLGKKDVKALTPKRKTGTASAGNYDSIKKTAPWVDEKTVTGMAKLAGLIRGNVQRITGSDELYNFLCQNEDEIAEVDEEELKGRIKAHTERILSMKLDKTTLNEKYMVEHIDQFLEYMRALTLTSKMKEAYPGIYDHVSASDQIRIRLRIENIRKLEMLIESLLDKYGMKLSYNSLVSNGTETWSDVRAQLRDSRKPSKKTTSDRQKKFDDTLKEFADASAKMDRNKEKQARFLVEESEQSYISRLVDDRAVEESLKENEEIYDICKPACDRILANFRQTASEALTAINEVKKSLVRIDRDREVILEQSRLRRSKDKSYNARADKNARESFKTEGKRLGENGKKAFRMLAELEKLRELPDLVSGKGNVLSEGAEKLLEAKGLTREYGMILEKLDNM